MELNDIRDEIDSIDDDILKLFLRRMSLSEQVAEYKSAHGLPILDREREREILARIREKAGDKAEYACSIFSHIMELSRERQNELSSAPTDGKLFGLLGRSLGHSWSVPIHNALGCSSYRLIELEPEELEGFFFREDIGGINVTIPYKREVMRYCGFISPEAERIGSVNTIIRDENGTLCGYNTDLFGLSFMAKTAGVDFAGAKTVIFGSGGAALTARYAALSAGASEVVLISRSGENNYENLSLHFDAHILINATPLGMYPDVGKAPCDPALFPNCRGVLDLVYNPLRTAFILRAQELGLPSAGGLSMLVSQAVKSGELFYKKHFFSPVTSSILNGIRQKMENIVLIGMPGCGKSVVGKSLSSLTGRELIDIDACIEKRVGISIPEIFRISGEDEFRRLEREEIERAGLKNGVIIVTGGGAFKDGRNYAPLRQNGRIYWLRRDISLLSRNGRPLSENADLEAMYLERLPMYERFCDCTIENSGAPKAAAEKIWRDFCENTCD